MNRTLNFTHEEQLRAIEAFYDRRIIVTFLLMVYGVLGVFGNSIVVMVYLRAKRMSSTHFLIFLIAIIDWLIALVVVPMSVVFNQYWLQINTEVFCKVFWTINVGFVSPGIYLLFGVSFIRYFHVCHPHKMYQMNNYFLKPFMVSVFLTTIFVSILAALSVGKQKWHRTEAALPGFYCNISDENRGKFLGVFYIIFYTSSYLLCLAAILVLNSMILRRMIRQRQIMISYKSKTKRKQTKFKPLNENGIISEQGGSLTRTESDGQYSGNSGNTSYDTQDDDVEKVEEDAKSVIRSSISSGDKRSVSAPQSEVDYNLFIRSNSVQSSASVARSYESRRKSSMLSKNGTIIENEAINVNEKTEDMDTETRIKKRVSSKRKRRRTRTRTDLELDRGSTGCKCCQLEGLNRTTLKLTIVSSVYVLCYMPFFIINSYINSGEHKSRTLLHEEFKYIINPFTYIPFMGCAVNPIIYTFVDPKFRNQCRALFGW